MLENFPRVRSRESKEQPGCLPDRKADDTTSPTLPKARNSVLWLHLWRLESAATSTFPTLGLTEAHFEKAKEEYGDSELSKAQLEKAAGGRGKPVCHTVGYMPTRPTISLSEGYEAQKPGAAIGFCFGLGLH